ncbi:SLC13 family permease [Amycolatopsis sp. lyj-90]|uniref:SLC13 family permease n=1 Tax=Amycolatopsis sp. lyj-90 TaxID=2789285 RepID=UPI00397E8C4D
MPTALLSIAVLVTVVALATVRPINMGVLGLVAAFVVGGIIGGESPEQVLKSFPANLFVILVGVTYLFAIAKNNGTVQWIVDGAFRLAGGRVSTIPWMFFLLAAVLCGIGALPPAVGAILVPMAMGFVAEYNVRPVLISILIGLGSTAGSFAPTGLLGLVVHRVQEDNGLASEPLVLFAGTFVISTVIAVATFMLLNRRQKLLAVPREMTRAKDSPGAATAPPVTAKPTLQQSVTLLGFVVLIAGALVFDFDIGFVALTVAAVLALAYPEASRTAAKEVSWDIVLLMAGILTYVGVLQRNGTIDWLGETVASVDSPLIAALLICLIGAVVSAFASTTGILGAVIPLTVPLVGTGAIGAIGFVTALAISSSLVDVSPFSTGGAIAMANAPKAERRDVYRGLLRFAGLMTIAGPLVSWAVLVAPGWL